MCVCVFQVLTQARPNRGAHETDRRVCVSVYVCVRMCACTCVYVCVDESNVYTLFFLMCVCQVLTQAKQKRSWGRRAWAQQLALCG